MKAKNVLSAISLTLVSIGLSLALPISTTSVEKFEVAHATYSVEEYYASITDDMSGNDLLGALNTLNKQKRKKLVTYAGMRDFARYSDADPDGSGKIVGFYDNALVGPEWDGGGTWNREHVWPNVRGGSKVEGDAHMTRPASTKTNSDRGSKGFGTESYDPGQFVAYYRGVASRIIFYAAIADTSLQLVEDPLNYHGGSPANSMGSLYDMLRWNLQYRPQDTSFTGGDDLARRTEINRNNVIEQSASGQGNRNPFIDHPEYACRIWGRRDATTMSICGITDGGETTGIQTMTLNSREEELYVGDTFQLTVSVVPETTVDIPDISWSSSNPTVLSVDDNGLVTALSEGKGSITFVTEDSKFSGACLFTVLPVELPPVYEVSLSLDKHEVEVEIGSSVTLTATVEGTDEEVELFWSSEDSSVANVNQMGKVKGMKEGETYITVATIDEKYSDRCKVVVKPKQEVEPVDPSPSNEGNGNKGCGGNIISTSVLLSTISLFGAGLILIRKFRKKDKE